MNEELTIPVDYGIENCRADKWIALSIDSISRTRIQEAFAAGNVRLNGEIIEKRRLVSAGDILTIILPPDKEVTVRPVDIPVNVIFEDDDIIVVNKTSGVVTHPGAGTGEDTLVHALLHHCDGKLCSEGGSLRPGVVHRLDKETSGVMVLAKTGTAYYSLIEQFSNREVRKEYLAIVQGVPNIEAGSIRTSIGRNPTNRNKMRVHSSGKEAHTDWDIEEHLSNWATLLRCRIHTGRTHQIRVHLNSIKMPVVGDYTYGYYDSPKLPTADRVYLHAELLGIRHPISEEDMEFTAPLPEDFLLMLQKIREME